MPLDEEAKRRIAERLQKAGEAMDKNAQEREAAEKASKGPVDPELENFLKDKPSPATGGTEQKG